MRARNHIATALVAATAAVALLAPAAGAQAPIEREPLTARFVPGEALVRYEPGTGAAERADVRAEAGVRFEDSLGLARTQVVTFDGPVRAAVVRLERDADVAYAQPNFVYRATTIDTFFDELWGLEAGPGGVDVVPAWERTRGAGQVVAVLDTGVDLTHPDLVDNLVPGRDFVDGDTNADDHHFHGTHVAATIAAVAGNSLGVAGVAPAAQIMPVRVLDGEGGGTTAQIANGIRHAALNGADVINMSLGGPGGIDDQVYADALAVADANDVVAVAAAGNDFGSNNDDISATPCTIPAPNLICVAALDPDGGLADYSNIGSTTVDVAAPGSQILSAKPDFKRIFEDGFEDAALSPMWNSEAWGHSTAFKSEGAKSATDSPDGDYAPDSGLVSVEKAQPLDLTEERGCRVHFDARFEIAADDAFFAGAEDGNDDWDGAGFGGTTLGDFEALEASIEEHDGRDDVQPIFDVFAGPDEEVADGAYVDQVRALCRDDSYDDLITNFSGWTSGDEGVGSYFELDGTSMATPHAAGVAALVRAADPGAPDTQVVQALTEGAEPLAFVAERSEIASGGRVDALGAIDAALAIPNPPPVTPTPTVTPPGDTTNGQTPVTITAPPKAKLRARYRAARNGRFTMRITGQPGTIGLVALRANVRKGSAARSVVVARKGFTVLANGKATVRLKLRRAGRRILLRKRVLRAQARVVLRNTVGLKSTATKKVRIKLRRQP